MQAQVPILVQTVVVHNGSQELIGPVKVQLTDTGRNAVSENCAYIVESIKPNTEERWTFYVQNQSYHGSPSTASTIVFRDASGSWWRRNRSEPVQHVHEDPDNVRLPKAMREAWDRNAVSVGISPSLNRKFPSGSKPTDCAASYEGNRFHDPLAPLHPILTRTERSLTRLACQAINGLADGAEYPMLIDITRTRSIARQPRPRLAQSVLRRGLPCSDQVRSIVSSQISPCHVVLFLAPPASSLPVMRR